MKDTKLGRADANKINRLMSGRLEKHMNASIRYNGIEVSCKEFYSLIKKDGYNQLVRYEYSDGVVSYRLENKNGSLYEIPKMVYDFFQEGRPQGSQI